MIIICVYILIIVNCMLCKYFNMKIGIVLIGLVIFFSSCWQVMPDGRKFRVNQDCIKGHNEDVTVVEYDPNLKMYLPKTNSTFVCDIWAAPDTVWKK